MERRLIVMRHAKSSWKSAGLGDEDRPLNKRGRRDAPRVGARLVELGWEPEIVLCSSAARARETLRGMEGAFEAVPEVHFLDALYLAGLREVEAAVGALSDEVAVALVLGHNYGWEHVVTRLTGEEVGLPTASAALLVAEGRTWRAAFERAPEWTLHGVIRPKELDG